MNNNLAIDLINILSFYIGLENLQENQKQIKALEEHLANQDRQYEKIIGLLEKGGIYGRKGRE